MCRHVTKQHIRENWIPTIVERRQIILVSILVSAVRQINPLCVYTAVHTKTCHNSSSSGGSNLEGMEEWLNWQGWVYWNPLSGEHSFNWGPACQGGLSTVVHPPTLASTRVNTSNYPGGVLTVWVLTLPDIYPEVPSAHMHWKLCER